MAGPEITPHRWKRIEYDRLIESDFFRSGEPVELLGAQLIVAERQGSRHFAAIRAAEETLRTAFGPGWEVRGQGPSPWTTTRSRSPIWPWCRAPSPTIRPATPRVRPWSSR